MTDKTISTPKTPTKALSKSKGAAKIEDVKSHFDQMVADDAAKIKMFDDLDAMFLMNWTGRAGKKWSKAEIKISPDARNAVLGAVRLMIATDPLFNVVNVNKETDQGKTEKLEKAINKIFEAAGRAAGTPIHYDALLSAILYSEMHVAITSTASLTKAAQENGMGQARAERMESITPFIMDVWQPRDCHTEFDYLGMTAYARLADTSIGRLRNTFGKLMPAELKDKKITDKVTLKTYYDLENTVIRINDAVVINEPHGLPFIPVMVQKIDGSKLWNKPEEATQPLLYTLLKSGMWEMQNMIYSVLFTVIRDMGVTPLYAHTTPPLMDGKPLDLDFDEYPGIVNLVTGETFMPLTNKGLVDPAVQQGLQIATSKGQESTIYPQALGAPMEGQSTFSELALLSQSGRLPLIGTQRRGGWGLGAVMEMCLSMMKTDGTAIKTPNIELAASDIPDYVQIDCKLDVKLPQDKLQQANIANMISSGDDPLMSKEWTRKEVLNAGQSGEIDKQIWTEKAANMMFQMFMQDQMQKQQQAQQAAAQAAMAAQGGAGGTIPGAETAPTDPMAAGPGMPTGPEGGLTGLPQAQAGIIPGAGLAAAPPPEGMV